MRLNTPLLPIEFTIFGPLMRLSLGFRDGPEAKLHPHETSYSSLFIGALAFLLGLLSGVGSGLLKQKEEKKDVLNLN